MVQRKIITTGFISVFLLMGCAISNFTTGKKKWTPMYRIQAGTSKGGIVENTDLTLIDNAGVDAFSGATLGFSTTPFRFYNGTKLGLFVDGYFGTRAYEDFYNRAEFEIPGTSFIKYGIIYQF